MKVLFLALDVKINGTTGDAVHVRELVMALAKLGNEVSLVVPNPSSNSSEFTSLYHQNIHLFFNKPNRRFRNLSTIFFCRKVGKSQGSEIVYERRFSPKISYALKKQLKIPFVVEINGIPEEEMKLQNMPRKFKLRRFRKSMRTKFFKSAGQIVVVSHKLKDALLEEYGLPEEKIKVIYNGANIELFKPLDRIKCLQELNLSREYRYIGFTGSLAPWQGVEELIEIAPSITKKAPDVRFLIVGDGIIRPKLERAAKKIGVKDKIIFTGFVPYKDVPKYINTFDVCVAPFSGIKRNVKYSFSAIKLYEYMACGKPVVTTDVCGIKKEIKNLNLGKVVKADNLDELETSIIEVLNDKNLQISMGKNVRDWVARKHSWDNTAEQVSKVCEGVLTGTTTI